ncbi:unnamed protein product [Amoebophrya sp. A120]|nr:unnamed protein product [Amoebophrya sp. A120]|eukprot:GSA120T00014732001.1
MVLATKKSAAFAAALALLSATNSVEGREWPFSFTGKTKTPDQEGSADEDSTYAATKKQKVHSLRPRRPLPLGRNGHGMWAETTTMANATKNDSVGDEGEGTMDNYGASSAPATAPAEHQNVDHRRVMLGGAGGLPPMRKNDERHGKMLGGVGGLQNNEGANVDVDMFSNMKEQNAEADDQMEMMNVDGAADSDMGSNGLSVGRSKSAHAFGFGSGMSEMNQMADYDDNMQVASTSGVGAAAGTFSGNKANKPFAGLDFAEQDPDSDVEAQVGNDVETMNTTTFGQDGGEDVEELQGGDYNAMSSFPSSAGLAAENSAASSSAMLGNMMDESPNQGGFSMDDELTPDVQEGQAPRGNNVGGARSRSMLGMTQRRASASHSHPMLGMTRGGANGNADGAVSASRPPMLGRTHKGKTNMDSMHDEMLASLEDHAAAARTRSTLGTDFSSGTAAGAAGAPSAFGEQQGAAASFDRTHRAGNQRKNSQMLGRRREMAMPNEMTSGPAPGDDANTAPDSAYSSTDFAADNFYNDEN